MTLQPPSLARKPADEPPSDALLVAMARERMRGRPAHVIAAAVGVHPSELSRWTNGRRRPTPVQRERLAGLLGLDVDELFPALTHDEPSGQDGSTRGDDQIAAGRGPES